MKKSISVWAFPEDWSLEKIFTAARKAGFAGVEVALAESGEIHLNATRDDIECIRTLAKKAGIELFSVATGLFWRYSLTSNNPDEREKAILIAKKQLDIAAWLECESVLMIPGMVTEAVSYDRAYKQAFDVISELEKYARERNVVIGLENVWNRFLLSPLEFKGFIDAINSPFVQVYFDVGNVVKEGYPEQWIEVLGKRITKVHFKDYKRDVGTMAGFCDILTGDVDYPAVMASLRAAGYDGWLTAEVMPYTDALLNNTSLAMDNILKV